jgi:hypothetical protein
MKVMPLRKGTYTPTSTYHSADRPGHEGVDYGANLGTPIYAVADGFVVEGADRAPNSVSGFGNWVWLDHQAAYGVDSIYGHVRHADILVRAGQKVTAGQMIARVGNEGQSTGPHLHFELWSPPGRVGGRSINPTTWLQGASEPGAAPTVTPPKASTQMDLVPYREQMRGLWTNADNTRQLIVQHTTESTGGNTNVIDYLERTQAGSYQTMIDFDGEEVRMVPDNKQAWAAMNQGNRRGIHVCAMGRAEWSRERWMQETKLLERHALRYAEWSRLYGIPLVKITPAQARAGQRGILGHIDVRDAWGEGDHWDPGYNFPYDFVIARAKAINGQGVTPPAPDQGDELTQQDVDKINKFTADFITGYLGPLVEDMKVVRQQITGGRDTVYKDQARTIVDLEKSYPGFKFLGGGTVPDAVAKIGVALKLPGFEDPKPTK